MKHNSNIKQVVRSLRKQGASLNQINLKTDIPKTTIRTWISDIKLSEVQIKHLKDNTQIALQQGRIKKQNNQKAARAKREKELLSKGIKDISRLSERDLLIAGVCLYWAEGFKNIHEHRLGFCNSDPKMIQFYITWLEKTLGVYKGDIVARLTINESYKDKAHEIEDFWSIITKIPSSQFTKTFYQKTKWNKQYSNNNYHGVLRVHVKKSINSLLLMRGWIEGLKLNL